MFTYYLRNPLADLYELFPASDVVATEFESTLGRDLILIGEGAQRLPKRCFGSARVALVDKGEGRNASSSGRVTVRAIDGAANESMRKLPPGEVAAGFESDVDLQAGGDCVVALSGDDQDAIGGFDELGAISGYEVSFVRGEDDRADGTRTS